jgi:DNA invertase Pin-like site-specific DNA recombinase
MLLIASSTFWPSARTPRTTRSEIIWERVNAGLARARQNGTKLGRRRVKPSVEATIRELRAKGDGILKIARALGVGTSVVQRVVLETA